MIEAGPAIIYHATPDVISDERHATIDLHGRLAGVRRRGGIPGERLPPSQAARRTLLRHRLPDAAGAPVPVAARNDDRPELHKGGFRLTLRETVRRGRRTIVETQTTIGATDPRC